MFEFARGVGLFPVQGLLFLTSVRMCRASPNVVALALFMLIMVIHSRADSVPGDKSPCAAVSSVCLR